MISILLITRKNSKFFSKFMAGFIKNTKNFDNVELLVLCSKHDTWNRDFFEIYSDKIKLFEEDFKTGVDGRHLFFNHLAQYAQGEWLWYMCDDHYLLSGYDEYLINYINQHNIDSNKINLLYPKVENCGSVSHIISRAWYNTTGRMSPHMAIDSYLNFTSEKMINNERLHFLNERTLLLDFTIDQTIMTHEHNRIEIDPSFQVYDFHSNEIFQEIENDAQLLNKAIENGK